MGCIKVGICEYCGEPRNIEAEEYDTDCRLDQLASEQCTCIGAVLARKKKEQAENCRQNIKEMLAEEHPEVAMIFEQCIEPIQQKIFISAKIDMGDGQKAMIKSTKDGLKIELEQKKKDEALA